MGTIGKSLSLICCVGLLAGCAAGRTHFSKGVELEKEGKLDEAVLKYAEAASENPSEYRFKAKFLEVRERAAILHQKRGDDHLSDRNYQEALKEYQNAVALNPSLDRASQKSDAVQKLIDSERSYKEGKDFEDGKKYREALRSYREALNQNPENHLAQEGIDRLQQKKGTNVDGFELNLKSQKPITLKFKDTKTREVFTILSKLSGINFIFDDTLKDANITLYMENASFRQALDLVTNLAKVGKKVLNESTIIIYPRTPEKGKQYEELVVRTFYLNHLDAKKAVNLLRTMLQLKKVYVNEDLNAIVIRDTPEMTAVAQKILDANDLPEAEVLLEVEVIEVSKKNADNFGLALSRYAVSVGAQKNGASSLLSDVLVNPVTTTTTGTTTTTTGNVGSDNLLSLFAWRGFTGFITVPNATYNFGKSVANGQVLSNPRIRVKNREKSKFNVGTRVPITTTSSNGTVGGVNVNVQYVDVGVKVNAEPTIQLTNDVVMKLSLEVSSILQKEAVGSDKNTTVVTIGTRNLDTVLSLKDGETSVIGGLLQDNVTKSREKISMLGDIPVLGALLSHDNTSDDKTELILAITPRIIRAVPVPDADVASFWSGREDEPSTANPFAPFMREPELGDEAAAQRQSSAAPLPAAVREPSVPQTPATQQVQKKEPVPAVAEPASGSGAIPPGGKQAPLQPVPTAAPAAAGAVPSAPPAVPATASPLPAAKEASVKKVPGSVPLAEDRGVLLFQAPATVSVGEEFSVWVKAEGTALQSLQYLISYDPAAADFAGITEGPFLKGNGSTTFTPSVEPGGGVIKIIESRTGDIGGGASGSGIVAKMRLRAKTPGSLKLGFRDPVFTGTEKKAITVVPYSAVVEVRDRAVPAGSGDGK